MYSHTNERCGWNESFIVVTQFVLHKREKDFTDRKRENRLRVHLAAAISKVERMREYQFE